MTFAKRYITCITAMSMSSYFASVELVVDQTLSEVDAAAHFCDTLDLLNSANPPGDIADGSKTEFPIGFPELALSTQKNNEESANQRYTILGEIAYGGQAVVLRAYDSRTRREVAIKQLRKRGGEVRFVNEAMITGRLAHRSIIPLCDVGHWEDGSPYFAMKLIDGRTLSSVLNRPNQLADRLPLLRTICDVAEGVAYAHCQGIIHRDLKPSNILMSHTGETLIIDWGIAKELQAKSERPTPMTVGYALTHAGCILGTPGYMAPEQATDVSPDERADVYAIGAMLYHVLAGVPPYAGLSPSDIIIEVQQQHPPTPLARFVDDASPPLAAIIAIAERAMSVDREWRYLDAEALLVELRRELSKLSYRTVH